MIINFHIVCNAKVASASSCSEIEQYKPSPLDRKSLSLVESDGEMPELSVDKTNSGQKNFLVI